MTSHLSSSIVASLITLSFTFSTAAKDTASPVSFLLKEKNKNSSVQQKQSVADERGIDEIDLDLKTDKARCEDIEKVLTKNYGPATSRRRNLRIWEIPNTDKTAKQSKMITIMAGEENGRYFVKLDRKGPTRGNNPRLKKTKQRKPKAASKTSIRTRQKTRSYERD